MRLVKNLSAKNIPARCTRVLAKGAALGVLTLAVAGCVVEPYPPPPPGAVVGAPPDAAVAAYPAPYAGVGPCCYSYPEYPPYYYGYAAPSVGIIYGGGYYGRGGYGYNGWRR